MQKKWIERFIIGILFLKFKIKKDKREKRAFEKKENIIFKQEEVLKVYEKWIYLYQKDRLISEYLIRNKYQQIAIYGLGRIGKNIYNELKNSPINILYIIDRKYNGINNTYYDIPCYHPEDQLPKVDLIIITVPGETKEISVYLRKKVDYQVKSIGEILYVV